MIMVCVRSPRVSGTRMDWFGPCHAINNLQWCFQTAISSLPSVQRSLTHKKNGLRCLQSILASSQRSDPVCVPPRGEGGGAEWLSWWLDAVGCSHHGPEEGVAALGAEHVVVCEGPACRRVHLEQQEEPVQHAESTCVAVQIQYHAFHHYGGHLHSLEHVRKSELLSQDPDCSCVTDL